MRRLLKALTKVLNPLFRPVAAAGLVPIWGIVRHRGRRSGRVFATPIALGATGDTFVVPLPWGEGTDWCRNLVAAGGGVIRYRGRDHAVVDPVVVSAATARTAFPAPIRLLLPRLGIERFLMLRRADAVRRAA